MAQDQPRAFFSGNRFYTTATNRIARQIEALTGIETRICVPGHMQRGGSPCPYDRVLATQFGSYAAKMVEDENYGITVAMKSNHVGENRLKDVAGAEGPKRHLLRVRMPQPVERSGLPFVRRPGFWHI